MAGSLRYSAEMHLLAASAAAVLAIALTTASATTPEWPQWRGPFNNGMALGDAPIQWGPDAVRWKLEISGRGHARWLRAIGCS